MLTLIKRGNEKQETKRAFLFICFKTQMMKQQFNVNMTLHYNFTFLICVVQWMYSASRKLQKIYI